MIRCTVVIDDHEVGSIGVRNPEIDRGHLKQLAIRQAERTLILDIDPKEYGFVVDVERKETVTATRDQRPLVGVRQGSKVKLILFRYQ